MDDDRALAELDEAEALADVEDEALLLRDDEEDGMETPASARPSTHRWLSQWWTAFSQSSSSAQAGTGCGGHALRSVTTSTGNIRDISGMQRGP